VYAQLLWHYRIALKLLIQVNFQMKTRVILAFLLLNFTISLWASPTRITLVYETQPNPPYYLGTDKIDWKKPGVTLEALKLLEGKLNIRIDFHRRPWARGLDYIKKNKMDGIFHSSFMEERLGFGIYPMKGGKPDPSRKIMDQSYILYKRKDSPLQWDGKAFSNLYGSIGVIIQYAIVEDLRKMGVSVSETRTHLNSLKMLVKERVAGVVSLGSMNDIHIKAHPETFKDIVKVSTPIKHTPYYLMFSYKFVRENPALTESIWDTIRDIHLSGEYDEIFKKYIDD